MLIASYYGYKDESGCTAIKNIKYFGGSLPVTIGFIVELLVMFLLPMIVPLMKHKISGEKFNNSQLTSALSMGVLWVCAHLAFQYAGLYGKSCEI